MTKDEILRLLADRNLSVVAARLGLAPQTLYGLGLKTRKATWILLASYLGGTFRDDE